MTNEEQFMEMIKQVDPELYDVKVAINTTGMNPAVIIPIMRSLSLLASGSGYGLVKVLVKDGIVQSIRGEETVKLEETVTLTRRVK